MMYFAYGSNINQKQMSVRCPNAIPVAFDAISGSVVFNKFGTDGTGKANIASGKGYVLGVVYDVPLEEIAILDMYEGVPEHYTRNKIQTLSGRSCALYTATITTAGLSISNEYRRTIIKGMEGFGFPEVYIRQFRQNMKRVLRRSVDLEQATVFCEQQINYEVKQ